jgi:hypothetical protein
MTDQLTSNELVGCIRQMGDWVRHLDECELNRWYKGNAAPKRCTCGLQGILDNVSAMVKRAEQQHSNETRVSLGVKCPGCGQILREGERCQCFPAAPINCAEQLVCRKCGSSDVMPWPTTPKAGE